MVTGWIAEDPSGPIPDAHQPVQCNACRQIHLINPKTRKTLDER
jgi:hypothetical protein